MCRRRGRFGKWWEQSREHWADGAGGAAEREAELRVTGFLLPTRYFILYYVRANFTAAAHAAAVRAVSCTHSLLILAVLKKLLPLAFLLLISLDSCNRTPKVIDPTSPAAARAQLNILRDSVNAQWQEMVASDDAKIKTTAQLLQALEQQPGTDRAQLQQLTQANSRLRHLRYDQQSMAVSERIDAYDAAQDSVLHAVYALALPDAGAPTPAIGSLAQTVHEADDQVIVYRVRYDEAAKRFNDYLQQHQQGLTSLGGQYAKLQPLPLFAIAQ